MPSFPVCTPEFAYLAHVERGSLERLAAYLPSKRSKVFVVSTEDIWRHQGDRLERGLTGTPFHKLFLPGGEPQKRLGPLEALACQMVELGGDRSSLVISFGGGIVTDMGGFLAAIFMRGVPVIQVPTTLLAQVDAAVGGKTGVNLVNGKNLIGSFHQPLAVIIDPSVVDTLPEREYRAGLYEVVKHGVIASRPVFEVMRERRADVLSRNPDVVEIMISESVRIKAEIVSTDERESGLRRILNFGHTFGHALEAETCYKRFLHGEAVAWGMMAATYLALAEGMLRAQEAEEIRATIQLYGPIPSLNGISADRIFSRLSADKKAVRGSVHFVLPVTIGKVEVVSGLAEANVRTAIEQALA